MPKNIGLHPHHKLNFVPEQCEKIESIGSPARFHWFLGLLNVITYYKM